MAAIEFDDFVDEKRELKLSLPADFPLGKVRVTVEPASGSEPPEAQSGTPWEERPWTKEEIEELLTFKGQTGAEIASAPEVGSWAHLGITDPVAWVEEVRQQEEERRKWPQD